MGSKKLSNLNHLSDECMKTRGENNRKQEARSEHSGKLIGARIRVRVNRKA